MTAKWSSVAWKGDAAVSRREERWRETRWRGAAEKRQERAAKLSRCCCCCGPRRWNEIRSEVEKRSGWAACERVIKASVARSTRSEQCSARRSSARQGATLCSACATLCSAGVTLCSARSDTVLGVRDTVLGTCWSASAREGGGGGIWSDDDVTARHVATDCLTWSAGSGRASAA